MNDATPIGESPIEPQQGESRFKVTANDIRKYRWQEELASNGTKECWSYYEVFLRLAKKADESGDQVGNRVYSLLHVVASFHAKYDDSSNPYSSMWSGFGGGRSLNPDDLVVEDLDALDAIVTEISDPEMRARVADVLWIRRRSFRAVQIAVPAFLESAQRLKTSDLWPPFTDRLERAAQISSRKGFEALETSVVTAIEGYIAENAANPKAGLLCHRLMTILARTGEGDAKHYAALSEKLATDFAMAQEWHFSEKYWRGAEDWHRRLRDEEAMNRCRLSAAQTYVARSEAGLPGEKPNYGYRAHWMGKGLEALRQAKAAPERIAEVHRRFLELEKQALTEMGSVSIGPDKIPGMEEAEKKAQEEAAKYVAGLAWEQALLRFLHIVPPTNVAEFKLQVEKQSEETIYDKIVSTVAVDRAGKVTDTMDPNTGGSNEETMRKKMVHQARTINWPFRVRWTLEPARLRLFAEHPIRLSDLRFFVEANPFVPPGHEGIYVRGFHAGFYGDWMVAMHILVPQVEASIRHVFQAHGTVTSTLESDGTQKERDLNQLLWMPQMEQIFGPDIAFDLRGVLIDRFGHNLRNESAHGLMPEYAFYQEGSVYLWWLLMRLCWMGYRAAQRQAATP